MTSTVLPLGQTLLLSAGPRAGKTSQLVRWRMEGRAPTQYLELCPEDAEPRFFLHRFFQGWPNIESRFDALSLDPLTSSWGARLGLAIAQTHPGFCLLLDDLHVLEASAIMGELLALFRHFPGEGTLVLTSRHRFPDIKRSPLTLWDADHPAWREQPAVTDLMSLEPALRAKALALHVVGEAPPSPEGWELIRRNIAHISASSVHRLRPAWGEIATLALDHPLPEGIWDEIAMGLHAFHERHLGTLRDLESFGMLNRIPPEVRRAHPHFLLRDGDYLRVIGKIEEARSCYLMALALPTSCSVAIDLRLRLANVAASLHEFDALAEILDALPSEPLETHSAQWAQGLNLKGLFHAHHNEVERAQALWQEVLAIPALGDRSLHFEHYRALQLLHTTKINLMQRAEASHYAERMVGLATEQGFRTVLLGAYMAHCDCLVIDETRRITVQSLVGGIPDEAFHEASLVDRLHYLYNWGQRLFTLSEFELARHAFDYLKLVSGGNNQLKYLQFGNLGLLLVFERLKQLEPARIVHDEFTRLPSSPSLDNYVQLCWAMVLCSSGGHQEAAEIVRGLMASPLDEATHTQLCFFREWIRHQRGEAAALDEIKRLLRAPNGGLLWETQAILLNELGLCSLAPVFSIHAFGELVFSRDRMPVPRWPRKKALALLAHLILHLDGCCAADLARYFCGDPENLESLHLLVYNLRQVLKPLGAAHLVEFNAGKYRLKWEEIAFCDLLEFDILYRKARSLEQKGMLAAAATFYELSLQLFRGPLFDNLPDDFDEARAAYRERLTHAQAFLQGMRGTR